MFLILIHVSLAISFVNKLEHDLDVAFIFVFNSALNELVNKSVIYTFSDRDKNSLMLTVNV